MGNLDDFDDDVAYASTNSSATQYRCEECGYKWHVKGFNEETDESDGTVYYDANTDLEPTACPLCGCSDILTL
ncbi:MAG: hypothetical protein A3G34_01030 [Candidatus Lindowbacteria bacterium RIFCSPLOWO2_12_FULL_62_27]|nr:MAG: hypothetical protein A3G34_01030 [Candidatus Lindowbacteria bacterium RIFCSPLOWO2_12_FULL_62_27]OGH58265.1 MAG: hypothetical protein A3I06_01245 [Candidatus Lindowbacteria bacterium RIFCSPLOWO2_02_FULL_62_12]